MTSGIVETGPEPENPDEDRFADIRLVITQVVDDENFPDGDVEYFEVTCLANGEATWRVRRARAEETEGGSYFPTG